jgi:plastocyanin
MRFPRTGAVVAAALVLSLGASACGSSSKSPTTTATTAGGSATTAGATGTTAGSAATAGTIHISGFKFVPTPAQVKVGQTITVTNDDNTDHSLSAVDGSFDTGVFSGGTKTITVTKAGTFAVHCKIHNFMTGSIVATA